MPDYQHIYIGPEGNKFLHSEEAVAVCGFNTADNPPPATPAVERCPDCSAILGLKRPTESW